MQVPGAERAVHGLCPIFPKMSWKQGKRATAGSVHSSGTCAPAGSRLWGPPPPPSRGPSRSCRPGPAGGQQQQQQGSAGKGCNRQRGRCLGTRCLQVACLPLTYRWLPWRLGMPGTAHLALLAPASTPATALEKPMSMRCAHHMQASVPHTAQDARTNTHH